MTKEEVYEIVKDDVVKRYLTFEEFDNNFDFVEDEEELEEIKSLLDELDIQLVDEIPEEALAEESDDEEETDDDYEDEYDEEVEIETVEVKESNEELCKLIQEGLKKAEEDLCNKNGGLVAKYARHYYGINKNKLEFNDLIQAGYTGLIHAAHKFDCTRKTAFTTYAVYWIRQSIIKEIYDYGSTIRVPAHTNEAVQKYQVLDRELSLEIRDKEKRKAAIAEAMGCSVDKIEELISIRSFVLSTTSSSKEMGEDEDDTVEDFLVNNVFDDPDESFEKNELKEMVYKALDTLTEQEREVLILHYGLDDEEPDTLEDIGERFGLSKERVRQIEATALRKLRSPAKAKMFDEYKDE